MVTNSSTNTPTAATGKVLQGAGVGTANAFSTATYPSTATGTGKILRADGTNWSATTATYPDTAGTSGNVLKSDGTNWTSAAPATSSISITGDSGGALTGSSFTFTGGTTGLTFAGATSTETLGGKLIIANGGTNATSFTQSNGIVTYNGTSLVNYAGPQISSGGVATNTSQPAFGYYNSTNRSNVTGAGTVYTLIFNTALFTQQGSGFDGTSTFTAPVTGIYSFNLTVRLSGVGAQTAAYTTLTHTAVRTYYGQFLLPSACASAGNLAFVQSIIIKMTAGDTLTATVVFEGSTQTVSVDGTAADTYLMGYLVC